MISAPRLRNLLLAATLLLFGAACQTPNQGTSTLDTSEETSNTDAPQQDEAQNTRLQNDDIQHNKSAERPGLEQNVARPGGDYREIAMDSPDPVACQEFCDKQMRCMAFTYVAPTADEGPRCRLKHSIPGKVENQDCCISGVNPRAKRRLAQLEEQGFELDTDRPGANFRSFEMDRPEPAVCQEACQNLIECEAFTYVRPGHRGDNAHCQLKTMATDKVTDQDCCISGVK
jgi:hypothetical protein